MKFKSKEFKYYFLITVCSSLLFIPFIGRVHLFDWDEINFAEAAREMIVTGDYLTVKINFESFWEKPPLFIWMQVLSMKIFGINEFAARFPNAIAGILTLLFLFTIGKKLYGIKFGLYWVLAYTGSILPFMYFKSGIIDPWFNLFIFIGIYLFSKLFFERKHPILLSLNSGFFIGLAILTKGPVAFLIVFITFLIYFFIKKCKTVIRWPEMFVFGVVTIIIGGSWFILLIFRGESKIVVDFIIYQISLLSTPVAGHGGFLLYHFVVLFIGVSPASILALPQIVKMRKDELPNFELNYIFKILFWVVLLLFSVVSTKILHYSSLCYFPLTYFAAFTLHEIEITKRDIKRYLFFLTMVLIILWILVSLALCLFDSFKHFIIESFNITDSFLLARMNVHAGWNGVEGLSIIILGMGIFYFIKYNKVHKPWIAYQYLFISTCVFLFTFMALVVPRIEKYSQNSMIELIKEIRQEDAYIITIRYKSYAHLYYGQAKHPLPYKTYKELLKKPLDRKLFAIIKVHDIGIYLKRYPKLKMLKKRDGFVLAFRDKY